MKKLLVLLICFSFVFISGCRFNITDTSATAILANSLAIEVGCLVKQSGDTETDRALRNVYTYAKTGEIPQDAVNQLNAQLAKHMDARPTLPAQITNLVALLGVNVDAETGDVIGISEVPPEVLKATARGYNSGFAICEVE